MVEPTWREGPAPGEVNRREYSVNEHGRRGWDHDPTDQDLRDLAHTLVQDAADARARPLLLTEIDPSSVEALPEVGIAGHTILPDPETLARYEAVRAGLSQRFVDWNERFVKLAREMSIDEAIHRREQERRTSRWAGLICFVAVLGLAAMGAFAGGGGAFFATIGILGVCTVVIFGTDIIRRIRNMWRATFGADDERTGP